jgi:archaellum biogenesis ATPase FlaH
MKNTMSFQMVYGELAHSTNVYMVTTHNSPSQDIQVMMSNQETQQVQYIS